MRGTGRQTPESVRATVKELSNHIRRRLKRTNLVSVKLSFNSVRSDMAWIRMTRREMQKNKRRARQVRRAMTDGVVHKNQSTVTAMP